MNQVIIYQNDEGSVSIVVPSPEALNQLGIEAIALKDVPAGVPYKIISSDEIPADRTFRSAWEAKIDEPDGIGADYGVGSKNDVIGWDENNNPIIREGN